MLIRREPPSWMMAAVGVALLGLAFVTWWEMLRI